MAADRVHLSVAEARRHSERALRGIGYDAEEACILADHMIDAALCGYEYSGLAKILNIPEHRRFKQPRHPIKVVRETEVSALYDGGNNVGMLAMYHATRAAIAKASTHGFSLIGVTNSWMSGRSAYYVEMIAKADLVGLHTASSSRWWRRSVAPARCSAPTRSPLVCRPRMARSCLIWAHRLSWGPNWRCASVLANCCPKVSRSTRRASRPGPDGGAAWRAAALWRLQRFRARLYRAGPGGARGLGHGPGQG